jgi:hypothetical protein
MPSVPWLLGANIRSLAGAPPTPPDFYAAPVSVSETLKFTAITAGADHTCALAVGGDAYCWGSNQYQQLGSAALTETCGNGRLACSSTPTAGARATRVRSDGRRRASRSAECSPILYASPKLRSCTPIRSNACKRSEREKLQRLAWHTSRPLLPH